MSLLSIIQRTANDLGLPQPSSVINNTDPNVRQLLAHVRAHAEYLHAEYDWQRLIKEATFTTQAQEDQGSLSVLASDFGRPLSETTFNRSQQWPVIGPRSAQSYAAEKGLAISSLRDTFRFRGGKLLMVPAPAAGETVAFEYVTKNKVLNEAGDTEAEDFAADTDTFMLDERLLRMGTVYRFLQRKGFPYAEEFTEHERALQLAMARDKNAGTLSMTGTRRNPPRVPDTGYGQ